MYADLSQAFYRSQKPELLETFRNISKSFKEGASESYTYYMYEKYPDVEDVRTYFSYEPNTINTFKLTSSDSSHNLESFLVIKAPHFGSTPEYSYLCSTYSTNVDIMEDYILVEEVNIHKNYKSESEDIKIDVEGELHLYDDDEGEGYSNEQFDQDDNTIDWFLDVKTYSEIIESKNVKINNFVQDASLRYFNKWLFLLDKIEHGISLVNLYLMINCYVLGIKVPDEIKDVSFDNENEIDTEDKLSKFEDKYNSYVEETNSTRNNLINKIRLSISKF